MLKCLGTRQRFAGVALAALLAMLCFWGLGDVPLLSTNEARRAVSVREMYASGEWLLPRMNGEPYLTKPPLFNWLALLPTSLLGSANEWAVRLPSAILGLLLLLGTYLLGTRIGGRATGYFACLFLAANAGFSLLARRAEIEMTLAAFCGFAIIFAWHYLFHDPSKRWSRLSHACLGGALLTKGPVALLLVTLPIGTYYLVTRDRRAKALLGDGPGWLVAFGIGGWWYCWMMATQGLTIWQSTLQEDIVKKIDTATGEPWFAYLGYLAGDFFPYWLVVLVRPVAWLRAARSNPQLILLGCVALVPLTLFSVFDEKHAKYLLPIYPALSVLLAWQANRLLAVAAGWRRKILVLTPTVMLCAYVLFYAFAEARLRQHRIAALPLIDQVLDRHRQQALYSLGEPDMRLVYYANRLVHPLSIEQVYTLAASEDLLFVNGPLPTSLNYLAPCIRQRFRPYLRQNKEAVLIQMAGKCSRD
ncbi:glycosyltransferase [Pseudomonas sp. CCOS 191]|nr:glycosyltransferase [Pseudomonas sp. CCOS 191]